MAHVRQHRSELLSDALTILRAYAVAGRPEVELPPFGSFEEWSRIVRGSLVWCGLPDPTSTRRELEDEAEEGVSAHAHLVEGWHQLQVEMGRDDGMTVKEALAFLEREPSAAQLLRDVLDGMKRGKAKLDPLVVARRLRESKDRNVGSGKILRSIGSPKEALRWQVIPVGGA
jgi:hypothetical protein